MSRIIIGDTKGGNTAIGVPELPESAPRVSQNDQAYWIEGLLGIDLVVGKATEQGRKVTQLLADRRYFDLARYVEILTVTNTPAPQLLLAFKAALGEARRQGREEKLREIRDVLGV